MIQCGGLDALDVITIRTKIIILDELNVKMGATRIFRFDRDTHQGNVLLVAGISAGLIRVKRIRTYQGLHGTDAGSKRGMRRSSHLSQTRDLRFI